MHCITNLHGGGGGGGGGGGESFLSLTIFSSGRGEGRVGEGPEEGWRGSGGGGGGGGGGVSEGNLSTKLLNLEKVKTSAAVNCSSSQLLANRRSHNT